MIRNAFYARRDSAKNFTFQPNEFIPLEEREYGLIRASGDRASTPHPKKWKTNLNALHLRLEEVKARHRLKESYVTSKNVSIFKDSGYLTPRQRYLEKRVLDISGDKKGSNKKVIVLSPRKTSENISCKVLPPKTDLLSFHERRRLFHEAEFTIAKHGKKMNDVFMGTNDEITCDDLSELDAYATLQLETLTAEHGLIHGALGVLSLGRSVKAPSSPY